MKTGYRNSYRNTFALELGRTIREAREKRGISQERLAEIIGMSQSSITNWEYGLYLPRVSEIVAMSVELDIPLDEFLKPLVELYNVAKMGAML